MHIIPPQRTHHGKVTLTVLFHPKRNITTIVAAVQVHDFVASPSGAAARAENVFLPERKIALVAASQPVDYDAAHAGGPARFMPPVCPGSSA